MNLHNLNIMLLRRNQRQPPTPYYYSWLMYMDYQFQLTCIINKCVSISIYFLISRYEEVKIGTLKAGDGLTFPAPGWRVTMYRGRRRAPGGHCGQLQGQGACPLLHPGPPGGQPGLGAGHLPPARWAHHSQTQWPGQLTHSWWCHHHSPHSSLTWTFWEYNNLSS